MFQHLLQFLLTLGIGGVFLLAMLDSSAFFFMPFAIDSLYIIVVCHHHSRAIIYLFITVAGSALGCLLTYWVVSKMSSQTIERLLPKGKFEAIQKKLDQHGFIALVVAALLPPPFPFSPFVLAAAIGQMKLSEMLKAVITGRLIRFGIEGILAITFHRQIIKLLNSRTLQMSMIFLMVLAVTGSIITLSQWWRKSHQPA